MNETLDIEATYRQERLHWMRKEAARRSFRQILTTSLQMEEPCFINIPFFRGMCA